MLLSSAISEFANWQGGTGDYATSTIDNYQVALHGFLQTTGDKPVSNIAAVDVTTWQHAARQKYKINTFSLKSCGVRLFFWWLEQQKLSPIKHTLIPVPQTEIPPAYIITPDEYRWLLSIIETEANEAQRKRNLAMIALLHDTGARISEILNMKIADLRDKKAVVCNRKGRKKKFKLVFWGDFAQKCANEWIEARLKIKSESDFLFVAVKGKATRLTTRSAARMYRKYTKETPLEASTLHDFRHTFAMDNLENEANLALVKDLMGHANITSTLRYTQYVDRNLERAARESMRKREVMACG